MTRRMTPVRSPWPGAARDRWLLGYADIVTLLFACFASLYATERDAGVRQRGHADLLLALEAPRPPDQPPAWLAMLTAQFADVPDLAVEAVPDGIVVSFLEAGAFAPGRADLSDTAALNLARLAEVLAPLPVSIRVEGHTDDRPIQTSAFGSNWELSTARATHVVQRLVEQHGIAAGRLAAAGYAAYRPRLPNISEEARARNRRVDLVILTGGHP